MKKRILLIMCLIVIHIGFCSALSISVHVPEKYTDIYAGDKFYFEIEVKYPENVGREDLRFNYNIVTLEGELIAQSKSLKAIETQISFIDFIAIPKNADNGIYLIVVVVEDYDGLSEEVSSSFHMVGDKQSQVKMYFFVLLGAIFITSALIMLQVFKMKKKRRFIF